MSTLWHFKIDGMWYKIGIFVYFLRIRLYITETASHWCNIFAHISQNFQWLIMKSFLLSYNIVNRLEYLPSFLPFSFLSFIHSFLLRGGLKNHSDTEDGFSHTFTFIVQDSETQFHIRLPLMLLLPHSTFFFTF